MDLVNQINEYIRILQRIEYSMCRWALLQNIDSLRLQKSWCDIVFLMYSTCAQSVGGHQCSVPVRTQVEFCVSDTRRRHQRGTNLAPSHDKMVSRRRGPQRRDRLASSFDLWFQTIRYLNHHWTDDLNIERELIAEVHRWITVLWTCGA